MQTETFIVKGMHCGGCVRAVDRALREVQGVFDVNVSLDGSEAAVRFDETAAAPAELVSAIEQAGYGVVSDRSSETPASKGCCCR